MTHGRRLTHEVFINAYLESKGERRQLDHRTLPSSKANRRKSIRPAHHLMQAVGDTSSGALRDGSKNPDLGYIVPACHPPLGIEPDPANPSHRRRCRTMRTFFRHLNTAAFTLIYRARRKGSLYPHWRSESATPMSCALQKKNRTSHWGCRNRALPDLARQGW